MTKMLTGAAAGFQKERGGGSGYLLSSKTWCILGVPPGSAPLGTMAVIMPQLPGADPGGGGVLGVTPPPRSPPPPDHPPPPITPPVLKLPQNVLCTPFSMAKTFLATLFEGV